VTGSLRSICVYSTVVRVRSLAVEMMMLAAGARQRVAYFVPTLPVDG